MIDINTTIKCRFAKLRMRNIQMKITAYRSIIVHSCSITYPSATMFIHCLYCKNK